MAVIWTLRLCGFTEKRPCTLLVFHKIYYFYIKLPTRMKICIQPIQVKNDSYTAVRPEFYDISFSRLIRQVPYNKLFLRFLVQYLPEISHLTYTRKKFATHLLEKGVDLRYIQDILGYESSKTTEIYTQITRKGLDKIRSPLDDLAF